MTDARTGRKPSLLDRILCGLGWHFWWHSQVVCGSKEYDICCRCGHKRECRR